MNADPGRRHAFRRLTCSAAAIGLSLPAAAAGEEPAKKEAPAGREVPRLLVRLPSADPARITWWNSERLAGELLEGDGSLISWKSALFTKPLRLKSEVIRRMDFPGSLSRSDGAFRIALTDGSHLTGDLEAISADTVTIKSAACGEVVIKRDRIVCMERITGPGIILAGPLSLLPESSRNDGSDPLFAAAGGRAGTPGFNLAGNRDVTLPDKCLIRLLLRSDSAPDFRLSAAAGERDISLETWGDELVLVQGEQFASAGTKIGPKDRAIQLSLAWDRPAGRSVLYGPDGSQWAELLTSAAKPPEPEKKTSAATPGGLLLRLLGVGDSAPAVVQPRRPDAPKGITLLNKGSGLLIEQFTAAEWSGSPPPPVPSGVAVIETDTESLAGEPVERKGDQVVIRAADGALREVPLNSLRAARWTRPIQAERNPSVTDLWLLDGTLVRGKLTAISGDHATLETDFATAPVTVSLDRRRALILPDAPAKPDTAALNRLDVIRSGETTLHGTIQPAGDQLPGFLPVGAAETMRPAEAKDLFLTRGQVAGGKFERSPALLHVKSGESLPVTLRGISRDRVEFTWDAASATELKPSELHAVQFAAPVITEAGFDGAGWRMIGEESKSPTRKGKSIQLLPGSGIGHPWLLQGGDVSFTMGQESGLATLRVRLFCQGTERDSNSLNFLIGDFGGEIYCGIERGEGQLENQTEINTGGKSETQIRISFAGDSADLHINGVRAVQAKIKGRVGKKSGTGIILETASLWGNQVGTVLVSGLDIQSSPFMAGPPPFSDEAKREALLLPRVRRDDPPRHVLIGRNGDLLRGEIEATTGSHFAFRAGLENFKVPVDRVAAAVWVTKPPKPDPAAKPEDKKEPEKPKTAAVPAAPAGGMGLGAVVGQLLFGRRIALDQAPVLIEANGKPASANAVITPPLSLREIKAQPGKSLQWLDLTNGGRIALQVDSWTGEKVTGEHELLGHCSIPASMVHSLSLKSPGPGAALLAMAEWKLQNTPDPVLPGEEGESSPLAGKDGAAFTLPMLEGDDFVLSKAKGKVVVLDFWATWCGPCVKSLPGLIEAMAAFPDDKVVFLAVNQGETKEQVKRFMEARGLKMPVAFDADAKVAKQYGVEGIPHTVVLDRDGKVAFTKTGYEPDGDKKIAGAVTKALEGGSPAPDKPQEDSPAPEKQPDAKPPAPEPAKPE